MSIKDGFVVFFHTFTVDCYKLQPANTIFIMDSLYRFGFQRITFFYKALPWHICMYICIYGIHPWRIFRSSYKKLTWVGFEPTTTESHIIYIWARVDNQTRNYDTGLSDHIYIYIYIYIAHIYRVDKEWWWFERSVS